MSDTWLKGIQKKNLNSERCVKDKENRISFLHNDNTKVDYPMQKSVTDLVNDEFGKQYHYLYPYEE